MRRVGQSKARSLRLAARRVAGAGLLRGSARPPRRRTDRAAGALPARAAHGQAAHARVKEIKRRSRRRRGAGPVLGRLGFTPNALTLIGSVLTASVGLLAAQGWFAVAGVCLWVFSALDTLDGALARATDRVSTFGAFLDSVCDRYAEAAVYFGIRGGTQCTPSRSAWRWPPGPDRFVHGQLRPRASRRPGPAGRRGRLVPTPRTHHPARRRPVARRPCSRPSCCRCWPPWPC